MRRIVGIFLTFAFLSTVPAYASSVVRFPTLPKGYPFWPLTFTASCKTKTVPIRLWVWMNGGDAEVSPGSGTNKSARAVLEVNVGGKTEFFAFMTANLKGPVSPTGDVYFRVKDGWLKFTLDGGSDEEKFRELMGMLLQKMGASSEGKYLSDPLESIFSRCLGWSVNK